MTALSVAMNRPPPPDPDIHATLSDYLGLTEALPSSLSRSLQLIENLRIRSEQRVQQIHGDAVIYSLLPSNKDAVDPVQLRRNISYALEDAERASQMAVQEASRLDQACDREARRLAVVLEKLKAQPMPPSRDPTPEQSALTSPNLKRERRMSTRDDEGRLEKHSRVLDDRAATKLRGRKIMVPGEVLPPPDPNVPPESISDWNSPRPSPPLESAPVVVQKSSNRPRSRTPRVPKGDKDAESKGNRSRAPRQPGQPGTNAHSAVAGISTSNALLALTTPPEDAPNGSKWLPWMKLTEWEMAKLRKRMKKNAIWVPSQTMVRRELKTLGRGMAGKEAARVAEAAGGPPFIDEHDESDPTRILLNGEGSGQMVALLDPHVYAEDEDADAELVNRGMRLNEAKKLKRQRMLEEQALQAQLAREQGVEVPSDGKLVKSGTEFRKRKRDPTPSLVHGDGSIAPASFQSGPLVKRLRISSPNTQNLARGATLGLSDGLAGPSRSTTSRARRAATPPTVRKPSLILKASKAVSEEPPYRRADLRRTSNSSLPNSSALASPALTGAHVAGRRSKRPTPGILASTDKGSTKVGVSKRKAAPKKKAAGSQATIDSGLDGVDPGDEFIDPNEPRFCVCADVSWGTMIACDNEDNCEKEWFHLSCVGLSELPPRRTKWYCPDCRKKLKLGQAKNGLVGRLQSR